MKRIDVIREIVRFEGLVVSNLGFPSRELFMVCDRAENFYMTGSMGMASSIGLGLSISQPKRVYVIDGDGSILMNLGTLATIANNAPENLCLVIVDNSVYSSTGSQKTCTAGRTSLAEVAKGCGNRFVEEVSDISTFNQVLCRYIDKALIVIARCDSSVVKELPVIPYTPEEIKKRFMGEAV